MKLAGDIIRFILTLFVHEQFNDYRLLYTIIDSAQHLYFLGAKKRKVYLFELLLDHGIWSDMQNWRECIEFYLEAKIEDAIRRKKRKDALEPNNSGVKKLFSGKLIKGML